MRTEASPLVLAERAVAAAAGGAELSLLTASHPVLDEDFEVEPGLVYTDSAHYLADHGVNIPMWDDLDSELAQLDAAHESAMKALAVHSDDASSRATAST